jgi:hypothetical protein
MTRTLYAISGRAVKHQNEKSGPKSLTGLEINFFSGRFWVRLAN